LENHSFLTYGLDPSLRDAYSLQGEENKKGRPPSSERGFPGTDADCTRCIRLDLPLKHGKGAGKQGFDATEDEILDCIKNANAKHDYHYLKYNCNDWTADTARECGLECSPGVRQGGKEKAKLKMQ